LINFLLALNVVVSVLIVFLVLMQRPKSEGLGAAFGGGMTENLFGAQTTNVLANATRWLAGFFFLLTLVLSILYSHQSKYKSSIAKQLADAPQPVMVAKPAATGSNAAVATPATPSVSKSTPAPAAAPAPSVEAAPATPAAPAASVAPTPKK
jgi:preprotein translocase subunit SecG